MDCVYESVPKMHQCACLAGITSTHDLSTANAIRLTCEGYDETVQDALTFRKAQCTVLTTFCSGVSARVSPWGLYVVISDDSRHANYDRGILGCCPEFNTHRHAIHALFSSQKQVPNQIISESLGVEAKR